MEILLALIIVLFALGSLIRWGYGDKIRLFFTDKGDLIRRLKKAKPVAISQVKVERPAKIIGQVDGIEEYLISPLTHRKCVYYEVIVEQQIQDEEQLTTWEPIIEERKGVEFVVSDPEGVAKVMANDAEAHLLIDKTYNFGDGYPPLGYCAELLETYGIDYANQVGVKWRFTEGVIMPGWQVAVYGYPMQTQDELYDLIFVYSEETGLFITPDSRLFGEKKSLFG